MLMNAHDEGNDYKMKTYFESLVLVYLRVLSKVEIIFYHILHEAQNFEFLRSPFPVKFSSYVECESCHLSVKARCPTIENARNQILQTEYIFYLKFGLLNYTTQSRN